MKKMFGLVMISVILFSIIPLAFAEQINSVVANRAKALGNVDDSVNSLSEKFSDTKEEKLKTEYQGAVKSTNEERMPVKARMIGSKGQAKFRQIMRDKIKTNFPNVDMKKIASLDRARLKKYASMNDTELKSVLANVRVQKAKVSDLLKKRTIIKTSLKVAEHRYDEAVKRYELEKEGFNDERIAWKEAVANGDEEAAIEHAKEYLLHASDMVIEYLEKVKSRIESNDDLTDEEAESMVADVDEKIQMMEDLKDNVEAANTKEELKVAARKIISAWSRSKNKIKIYADALIRTRVGEILRHSELLESKINNILERLGEQGKNISEVEEKVDEFSEIIDDARELYKEGKELLVEAKEKDNPETAKEGKEEIVEAHKKLQEAHKILMEIVRDARADGWVKKLTLNSDDIVEIIVDEEESGNSEGSEENES